MPFQLLTCNGRPWKVSPEAFSFPESKLDKLTHGFAGSSVVRNLPAMQETPVGSLGLEDPLGEVLVAQSCPTLCNPMDCPVHGISQARILEWVALRKMLPTEGSNLGLPHCRQILYHLSLQGSPWRRKWQPAPGFLPGQLQGQRSLAGYSSWGSQRVRYD